MKKIISFSLWGNNPIYTIGAIKNAELAKEIYPDWICRFYIGKTVPNEIVEKLESFDNIEIINMNVDGNWTSMFWRFYPASDETVDVMISRDCDSRLNTREKEAVDEWLNSDKGFHIMRDHPYHTTEILGGMWGIKKRTIPNMKEMIEDFFKGDYWQVDQDFLKQIIFPLIKNDSITHDEFFVKNPFPNKRVDGYFVGQAFDENDNILYPEHSILI